MMDGARFALPPAGTAVNRNQSGGSQPGPPTPGPQPPLPPRPRVPAPVFSPLRTQSSGPESTPSRTLVSEPRTDCKARLQSSRGRSPHPLPGLRGPITVGAPAPRPPPPRAPQVPPRSDSASRAFPGVWRRLGPGSGSRPARPADGFIRCPGGAGGGGAAPGGGGAGRGGSSGADKSSSGGGGGAIRR